MIRYPPASVNRNPGGHLGARNLRRFLAAILIALTADCAQDSLRGPSQSAQAALASSDRLIVPGERIGPLRLAGKVEDVVRLFGPGNLSGSGMWAFSKLQTWDAIGLWVDFDPGTGNVLWISIDNSGSNPWAAHATADGIRIDARQEDVLTAMGPPERTVTGGGATSLYYDRRGIRLTVADTGTDAGKVGAIRIVWPSLARGGDLVVPGKNISGIEVGMPVERVLALLGGGYHSGPSAPGLSIYYWPHLGLSLIEGGGRVISVRAGRQIPADAAGIRHATAEGLGDDSAAAQIRDVFGEPPEANPALGWLYWIYRSRGIAFALDAEQKVRLIDVFGPEIPETGESK